MTKLDLTTKYFLQIITVIFISYSFIGVAYAQNASVPVPVEPTIAVPAETAPNPNLQYLPQKAYVQTYGPELGLPNSPTPALPSVQPIPVQQVPVQQNTIAGIDAGTLTGIVGVLSGATAYLKGHFANKKADKAETTSQANAETNVKQAAIQQKTLEQVYENMPDKGASIQDKPEIKLEEVAKVKDEALKTATKA